MSRENQIDASKEAQTRNAAILDMLQAHGWSRQLMFRSHEYAKREYLVAVGKREATASAATMTRAFGGETCMWAEYSSEGRNILERFKVVIPGDATPEQIRTAVAAFAAEVDAAVAQSYAGRLYFKAIAPSQTPVLPWL